MYAVVKEARRLAPSVKGLHSTALLEWERGDSGRHPSDEQLVAWAGALGLTVELREPAPPPGAPTEQPARHRRRAA